MPSLSLLPFLAAAPAPGPGVSVLDLLRSAEWVAVPLAAASIAGLTLIFYCLMTLRRGAVDDPNLAGEADTYFENEDLDGLARTLARRPQASARVLAATLEWLRRHPDADAAAVRAVAEAEGGRIAARLNQRAMYVMDVGVLAPLVGLFGTVVGILRSFGSLTQEAASPMRTLMLAGGVSQALISTAAGLIIGLVCMAAYAFLRGRALGLVTELESAATKLVQALITTHERVRVRRASGAPAPAPARSGTLRMGAAAQS